MELNYCSDGGHLVGARYPVAADPTEYQVDGATIVVGCNRLRCSVCGVMVKQYPGRLLTEEGARHIRSVYEKGPPFPEKYVECNATTASFRLYMCKCRHWAESGITALDDPDADSVFDYAPPWRCVGHPMVTLPFTLDGIRISEETDIEAVVRRCLVGSVPEGARPEERSEPARWVMKLYVRVKHLPLGARVAKAVAGCLTDREIKIRLAALRFFFVFPTAPGAESVDELAGRYPDIFHGDEGGGERDRVVDRLAATLVKRAEVRLEAGDRDGVERLKQMAMAGCDARALYDGMYCLAPEWTLLHARELTQVNPGVSFALLQAAELMALRRGGEWWPRLSAMALVLGKSEYVDRSALVMFARKELERDFTLRKVLSAIEDGTLEQEEYLRMLREVREQLRGQTTSTHARRKLPKDQSPIETLQRRWKKAKKRERWLLTFACLELMSDPEQRVRELALEFLCWIDNVS